MPSSSQKRALGYRKPAKCGRQIQTVVEVDEMLNTLGQNSPRTMHSQPCRWIIAVSCADITSILEAVEFFKQKTTPATAALVDETVQLLKGLRTISASIPRAPPLNKRARAKVRETLQKGFANETFMTYTAFWYKTFREGIERDEWYPRLLNLFWVCKTGCRFALREAEHGSKAAHVIVPDKTGRDSRSSLSSFECQGPAAIPSSYGSSQHDPYLAASGATTTGSDTNTSFQTQGRPYHQMQESVPPRTVHKPLTPVAEVKSSRTRRRWQHAKVEIAPSALPRYRPPQEYTTKGPVPSGASMSQRTKSRSSFSCFRFSTRTPSSSPPPRSAKVTVMSGVAEIKESKRTDSGWSSFQNGGSRPPRKR